MQFIKSVLTQYNGLTKRIVFEKPIRINDKNLTTTQRGYSEDPTASLIESLRRAKRNLYDLIIQNEWTHWGTLTLNGQKIESREDIDIVSKSTRQRLNNIQKKDPSFKYVMVFEPHKKGGYHMHLFIYTDKKDTMVKAKNKGRQLYYKGRPLYNWKYWSNFGFNSFLNIEHINTNDVNGVIERLKITNYITKYITKEFVIDRFNKKKYWCSKGLERPIRFSSYEILDVSGVMINEYNAPINKVDNETGELTEINTIKSQLYITLEQGTVQ